MRSRIALIGAALLVVGADGQPFAMRAWNAAIASNGSTVTARDASYDGTLAAGGSTSFGFTASSRTADTAPAVSAVRELTGPTGARSRPRAPVVTRTGWTPPAGTCGPARAPVTR